MHKKLNPFNFFVQQILLSENCDSCHPWHVATAKVLEDEMKTCFFCKNDTVIHTYTTYMVDLKDCIIIVKNVPCEECSECGEKFFSDEVMEKLEAIVNKVRGFASEVFVTDYSKQAA